MWRSDVLDPGTRGRGIMAVIAITGNIRAGNSAMAIMACKYKAYVAQ